MVVNNEKLPGATPIFMTDISQVEMDNSCGMKYWMNRYEGGNGIVKRDTVTNRLIDTEIHNDLRMLSMLPDISPLAIQNIVNDVLAHLTDEDKQDTKKMELLYRRLGWFAAYAIFIEPEIRFDYDTLSVDPAIVLDRDPLWVVCYPDRLLQRKGTKEIIVREYVPMGPALNQDKWLKSWHYNIRLHALIAAAQDMDLKVVSAQAVGMARGYVSLLDNRLVHPYVWGYHNKSTEEWAPARPENMKGNWSLAPVWQFGGGIVSWIRMCGCATARSQFQVSRDVFLNKDILDAWIASRTHRERAIKEVCGVATSNRHLRNVYFPQVTTNCAPADGDICPYRAACWDKTIGRMPLKSEQYIKNDPAKLGELIQ